MRSVARRFNVSLLTVQRWVARAEGRRLDRVEWTDHSSAPAHQARQVSVETEELVMLVRKELKRDSDLGEFGAAAIWRELCARGYALVPSERTINRILERRGALDAAHRTRRKAPPRGWHLPDVAAGRAELDEWDVVEGLVIRGGVHVEVLNVVSLHGGLVQSWPCEGVVSSFVCAALKSHWREVGLPEYAQFDNDARFTGTHKHPDSIGSVIRLCLKLGVTCVFAPPRETGFQAAIEGYNGRWQAKVWTRFEHSSMQALQEQSARYVTASRQRSSVRIEAAPPRRSFPELGVPEGPAPACGRLVFIRRTNDHGEVQLLGRTFLVDSLWTNRLVRCQLQIEENTIRCYRLRRRDPADQPLAREIAYHLPDRMLGA